ncbi:hypothetical protein NL676_033285 [Syzygium grande]|nr:hypothetical protein NL676_033285 [Syzygium grande]
MLVSPKSVRVDPRSLADLPGRIRSICGGAIEVRGKMTQPTLDTPLVPSSSSRNLPDFKKSVKLKYVKLGYHYVITHGMYLFLSPFVVAIAAQLSTFSLKDLHELWIHLQFNLISVILCSTLLVFLTTLYFLTRPRPVYLVDFSCYKADEARKCTKKIFMDQSRLTGGRYLISVSSVKPKLKLGSKALVLLLKQNFSFFFLQSSIW